MTKKDPKDPSTTSLAYDRMAPKWTKIQTVLDGTEAMRAAERAYLPQHDRESDKAYMERLHRNTLFNMTKITLESWVGRPFSEPIEVADAPSPIEEMMRDVDLLGNDIDVFCRNWFRDGVAKAYSHAYVDFPRVDRENRTMADDIAEAVRPYWVHIRPEDLIFADAAVIDGREVLREVRIKEEITERDGFTEVCKPQIRRITLIENEATGGAIGYVELYQLDPNDKKKKTWIVIDSFTFDLDVIPLVTFYADRESFMVGCPPLEDLADLNVAHWQSTSDQRAILTVTRFPMLALSGGVDEDNELTIGPNQWLWSPDPQGKFYYVEHNGAAIEQGREDLNSLETQMAEYGAEFLKKRPGGLTATARALDSAEATSPLQDMTIRFADALTLLLDYTARWLGADEGGTATLETDFGPETIDRAELDTLKDTRKMKEISRRAYLEELKRRGLLPEEYDIDEDLEELENETLAMTPVAEPFEEEEDSDENPDDDTDSDSGDGGGA